MLTDGLSKPLLHIKFYNFIKQLQIESKLHKPTSQWETLVCLTIKFYNNIYKDNYTQIWYNKW